MIFWDTSAIVPLVVDVEVASAAMRELWESDGRMVVWWGTLVECNSAIARREREGGLSDEGADLARSLLEQLKGSDHWVEVLPTETVRGHAGRLLRRHPLRSADALQLGAALTWSRAEPHPARHRFVTLDLRLAAAARREGFGVVAVTPGR